MAILRRSTSAGERYFSEAEEGFISGTAADGAACGGQTLSALSTLPLKRVQWLFGWKLDDRVALARIMQLREAAIVSEKGGNASAADFYFRQCLKMLKTLPADAGAWRSLAEECSKSRPACATTAASAYRHFVDEVFLDLHCAFYNGYGAQPEAPAARGRQSQHLQYIRQLLDLSQASLQATAELLAPGMEEQCSKLAEAKRMEEAVALAADLLTRFPDRVQYVDLQAKLLFDSALSRLSSSTTAESARADASRLSDSASRLDRLVETYPDSLMAYQYASDLHRLRAIRLANGGEVAQALVEIHKSLAYWPGDEAAQKDANQILELIDQAQKQMAQMKAQLSANSRLTLNADGERLRREATAGTRPAKEYCDSKKRAQIVENWQKAQFHSLWRRVGLATPEQGFDEKAAKFFAAVSRVNRSLASDPQEFAAHWQELTGGDADPQSIDTEQVRKYLAGELVATPPPPQVLKYPSIAVAAAPRRGSEPFLPWLCSVENPWLKVQVAAAVCLLLAVAFFGLWHSWQMHQRDAAWTLVTAAQAQSDDLATVIACEKFFSTSPPDSDPRSETVRNAYRAALTRWFISLPGDPDSAAVGHIQQYRKYAADWKQGGTS